MIEGEGCCEALQEFIFRYQLGVAGVWQPNGYGGLMEFGGKPCLVYYTQDYRDRLGDEDVHLRSPNEATSPRPVMYSLSNLGISVVFKCKASARTRHRFADSIAEWGAQVVRKGMFDEGPIQLVSPRIDFRGRLAQFRIDVSQTGQHTLNWLVLSILNFAYVVTPVTHVIFDHDENIGLLVEGLHGPIESLFGEVVTVPIHRSHL